MDIVGGYLVSSSQEAARLINERKNPCFQQIQAILVVNKFDVAPVNAFLSVLFL